MKHRVKLVTALVLILLCGGLSGWAWYLSERPLHEADSASSVLGGFAAVVFGVTGVVFGVAALRQTKQAAQDQGADRNGSVIGDRAVSVTGGVRGHVITGEHTTITGWSPRAVWAIGLVMVLAVSASVASVVVALRFEVLEVLGSPSSVPTPTSGKAVPPGPLAEIEAPSQPVTISPASTTPAPMNEGETDRATVQPGDRWVSGERSDSAQATPEAPPPLVTASAPPAAPVPEAVATATPTRVALYPGEQLAPGERLQSPDGRFVLVMQLDGNLVQRAPGNQPVWSSNTFRPNSVALMQSDGNFVVRAPGNVPVWATGTGYPESVLEVQNDGNVVVYSPGHIARWSSFDHGSTLANP